MSSWIRPLTYAGLEVVPAGLWIITDHPWLGAGTFVLMFGATLVHSRRRLHAAAAQERARLRAAHPRPVREPVRERAGGPAVGPAAEERPLRERDTQLIHYPPRRF